MITVTNIEQYTNDIRETMLGIIFGGADDLGQQAQIGPGALAHAFDRATVAALFKASQSHTAQAPPPEPILDARVKPGSKEARARAKKAAATRRENREKREAFAGTRPSGGAIPITNHGTGAEKETPDGAA